MKDYIVCYACKLYRHVQLPWPQTWPSMMNEHYILFVFILEILERNGTLENSCEEGSWLGLVTFTGTRL